MFKRQKNSVQQDRDNQAIQESVKPLWQRGLIRVGTAGANVLSGIFNMTIVAGFAAMHLASYGNDPLDGLNNILTDKNIEVMESITQTAAPDAVYTALLQDKKYTFYGDMNHAVGAVRGYFFGAENTQNIINAGVKHVFIEYPQAMQPIVDDLAAGKTTKAEFVKILTDEIHPLWWTEEQTRGYHELMADMIVSLTDAGVKMHFSDPGLGSSGMSIESKDMLFEMAGVIVKEMEANGVQGNMSSMEIFIATQKFIYSKILVDPEYKIKMEKLYDEFFEKRLGEDNQRIAAFMKSAANDEKSVILYGSAHMMREHDLDEMLGKEDTQLIGLYGDKRQYGDALISFVYSKFLPQQPDKLHMLDEQQVYMYEEAYMRYRDQTLAAPHM